MRPVILALEYAIYAALLLGGAAYAISGWRSFLDTN